VKQLKICDFTEPELDVLRRLCNFSDIELQYFNLRARDKTLVEIALEMNISQSTVSLIGKRVKNKIIRIL